LHHFHKKGPNKNTWAIAPQKPDCDKDHVECLGLTPEI
jgi:hypothetical protein